MTNTKRKALLAAIAAVCGVAVAVPMVVSGTASAQTNSRLCGRFWTSTDATGKREMAANLYEVRKNDDPVCDRAKSELPIGKGEPRSPNDGPFKGRLKNKDVQTWQAGGFAFVVCEDWKPRNLEFGGLENLELNFIGNNFPSPHDQFDICNNMNRSDTTFDMQSYWLYHDGEPGKAGKPAKVDFQRD